MKGARAGQPLPAADGRVDIGRVELQPVARRPVRSAAITVVPLPRKASSTMSPRAEQSRIASATIATGFTVGCNAKRLPSAPAREKELAPGYCQTLLRLRPNWPS